MATKSSSKTSSHRPQTRKTPSATRKSSAGSHGRSAGHANGKHQQAKTHPGIQGTKGKSAAASKNPKSTSPQAKSRSKPSESSRKRMGTKLSSSVKQHPIASVALGAGAGLLLVEGVRRAIGAFGNSTQSQREDRGDQDAEDSDQDSGAEGSQQEQSDSDDKASDEENADEEDDESDPQSRGRGDDSEDDRASDRRRGITQSAKEGFNRGVEMAQTGWEQYPLAVCAAALGVGVLAGMLLPSSSIEDQMMGQASDRVAGRFKKAGGTIKELAQKAYEEAASTARDEAERVGLTPDHLGRKVKRLAVKVRDAVSDAVQG
jgi:ElaB/YqjD/DUF883 family membrane-anchored ribosome-binding protein